MSLDKNLNVRALVSIGQHEKSGRAQRASQDARAVELGLKLVGKDVELVHVGEGNEAALRQYLGMGLPDLTLLKADDSVDAATVLLDYFQTKPADILLAGIQAENNEASGLLPYWLAEKLGWPIVDRIADIQTIDNGHADILQALPRGQRRLLRVPLPFIATVDNAAPAPRQYAYGAARRATLSETPVLATIDADRQSWLQSPAKPRPKRLNVVKATSAADRFKAATAKPQGQGGQVIKDGTDREKAERILAFLTNEGVVR